MDAQVCPMERMERLLVATDGSESSRSAVEEAIQLAKACSSKLIAMTTVLTNIENAMPWVIDRAEKEMQEKLESIRGMASEQGIDCETYVYRGEDPYMDIVNAAAMEHVDMIVMGTRRRTGIKKLIMGSVTGNVIGYAPCKVLVVPPGAKTDYRSILIATDGSIHSAAAASEAAAIAKRYGSSLVIVSVAPSAAEVPFAGENVKQVMELAEKEGLKKEGMALPGKPHEVILEIAKQKHVGLIVIGSHGKTSLMSLLMGSVTERVISLTESAVLVVKASYEQWERSGQYARMFDPKNIGIYGGEVITVDEMTPGGGMSNRVWLGLKTEKGMALVILGPSWFHAKKDFKIEPGDKVEVKGSLLTAMDEPMVIATEVKKDNQVLRLRDDSGYPVWAPPRKKHEK
jgi:nucleotide-binding universal stress UspA family protein